VSFGAHDDTGPKFYDDHTVVFGSTAVDPKISLPAEVERNGNIPNVWTLDLRTGELRQWTDTATGNVSPVVLRQAAGLRVAFISYYKGENGIHAITGEKPIATVASDDFGVAGAVPIFIAPISHQLLRDNIHKKGMFEKMTLAGRPPVNLGVTSGGNLYGNTQITFTDVLGDKQMSFYAQSVAQFRTTAFTYINTERRLQYALQGFSQDTFFFGQNSAVLYDPSLAPFIDRDLAEAVQSQRGGTGFFIYPFNRYARAEMSTGYLHISEEYTNPALQQLADQYQTDQYGRALFRRGHMIPIGVSFIKETTIFREYGPVAGSSVKFGYNGSPGLGDNWLQRNTIDADLRYYKRIVANGVFALRFRGQQSFGRNPDFLYFGGNSEMRGYEYLEFIGQKAFFGNAELRFPLIEAMLTPLGVLGGLRGVFFANFGGASFNNQPFTFMTNKSEIYEPILGYQIIDALGNVAPVFGPPVVIDGLRLRDGRGSYGIGLESFLLGFPMHFDWSWKSLFNKTWEDNLFALQGGSAAFRKVKFSFWIGYDF
jgi:outer membrane protein assembly factor BamA